MLIRTIIKIKLKYSLAIKVHLKSSLGLLSKSSWSAQLGYNQSRTRVLNQSIIEASLIRSCDLLSRLDWIVQGQPKVLNWAIIRPNRAHLYHYQGQHQALMRLMFQSIQRTLTTANLRACSAINQLDDVQGQSHVGKRLAKRLLSLQNNIITSR